LDRNGTEGLGLVHFESFEIGVCVVGFCFFIDVFLFLFSFLVCYLGIFGVVGDLTSLLSVLVPSCFFSS
jgi:hypothetical protein